MVSRRHDYGRRAIHADRVNGNDDAAAQGGGRECDECCQ
jgi:hypothetical protein